MSDIKKRKRALKSAPEQLINCPSCGLPRKKRFILLGSACVGCGYDGVVEIPEVALGKKAYLVAATAAIQESVAAPRGYRLKIRLVKIPKNVVL